ncbi:RNA-dependent RNA polymerase [Xylariales sp. AK1849]|nr:RNA-dependent RNA polymerase [Xylariales sp. AK1849]
MEVFMHNLPLDLSDQGLQKHMTPLVKALGIKDWNCQKQRKRKTGAITFLHVGDGEKFLRQHGEQEMAGVLGRDGQARMRARLTILNTPVYCKRSFHVPDAFLLKSLSKTADDLRDAGPQLDAPENQSVVFSAQSLSCGYYCYNIDKELDYSPEVSWPLGGGVAKFARSQLIITFQVVTGSMRIEIPYRTIEAVLTSNRPNSMTLTLWEAPRFFEVLDTDTLAGLMDALHFRQGPSRPPRNRLTELPYGTRKHSEVVGQCLIYRIFVAPQEFHKKVARLREIDILSISHHSWPSTPLQSRSLVDGLKSFNRTVQEFVSTVPFDVLFQLQALVQNGYLLPWTVRDGLIRLAKLRRSTDTEGPSNGTFKRLPISAAAIKKLFSQIPFPAPDIDASTFEVDEIMVWLERNEREIRQGLAKELLSERARNNLTMVYKVQVTPTCVTLHGPEPEAKNRILRKFPDHTEYFIRVQFCDEDGQDIHFNYQVSNDTVYNRFLHLLNNGIPIGGRKYDFLGFSHSSLRSHATWFMATFYYQSSLQTYFTVISDLGKFNKIYSPARCAARIGQAFSETPFAISLTANGIKDYTIDDKRSADGTRVFTDGVGVISDGVKKAIEAAMPQRKEATCYQIRWGGAKGMLALDPRLTGKVMAVRASMVKFESEDNANLEICDMANKPIPLVLNRQMIKILEDMAVPNEWFFEQQNKELNRLRRITAQTINTIAFLKRQKIADHIGLPQLIRRLDKIGIDYKKDRFLSSVVETVVLRELRLLKHKARIPIEKGVTLFGIADETGFLEEEQIYITFEKSEIVNAESMDLDECEMIVTRSPALHPGDIQLATNIIPPKGHPLRSLRNCIVFSQKGTRDLPSQLSGGDLDGDIYNVIWDQFAVRNCKRVFAPADYPRVEPKTIDREVRREDMTAFFVEFMKTDNLGLIAVKHMVLADQKDAGTVDQGCVQLAEMHSTSVDYSKTGVPVDMSVLRRVKSNPYRPDFLAPAPPTHLKNRTDIIFEAPTAPSGMEDEDDNVGPRHKFYRSEKILGLLYRAIDEKKIWNENVHVNAKKIEGQGVWNGFLAYVTEQCETKLQNITWTESVEEAQNIKSFYEDAISTACMDYSDHASIRISELEVFTGAIFNKSGVLTRRQKDRSLQLKDEYDRITQVTEAMIRRKKVVNLANEQDDDLDEASGTMPVSILNTSSAAALELSIACLNVGCVEDQRNANNGGWGRRSDGVYQSFKVVAACCLVKELDAAIKRAEVDAGSILLGR